MNAWAKFNLRTLVSGAPKDNTNGLHVVSNTDKPLAKIKIDIKNKLMFALCYKKIMNNDDYEVLNKIVNQLVEERQR